MHLNINQFKFIVELCVNNDPVLNHTNTFEIHRESLHRENVSNGITKILLNLNIEIATLK
mgnify:CR=1 FL=1